MKQTFYKTTRSKEGFESLSVSLIMNVILREIQNKNLGKNQASDLFEELFPTVKVLISDEAQNNGIFTINFYKVREIIEKHLKFLFEDKLDEQRF